MSARFPSIRRLPPIPLEGTCDGSGDLTITFKAPQWWTACYVAVRCAGSPSYALDQGTAQPIAFGSGAATQVGPILLGPLEVCNFVVTGATAGATVAAQVLGWMADTPEEVAFALSVQTSLAGGPAGPQGRPGPPGPAGGSLSSAHVSRGRGAIPLASFPAAVGFSGGLRDWDDASFFSYDAGAQVTTLTVPSDGRYLHIVCWRWQDKANIIGIEGAIYPLDLANPRTDLYSLATASGALLHTANRQGMQGSALIQHYAGEQYQLLLDIDSTSTAGTYNAFDNADGDFCYWAILKVS